MRAPDIVCSHKPRQFPWTFNHDTVIKHLYLEMIYFECLFIIPKKTLTSARLAYIPLTTEIFLFPHDICIGLQ